MAIFEITRTTFHVERFTIQAVDPADALKRFERGEAVNRLGNQTQTEVMAFEWPAVRTARGSNGHR
ncbi:hypothetical protein C7441_11047 [Pseudaminobacter salicylatoxidans]|uniref:Uncharacterized protein n=1 Tax=Pseudaminobacter salicylatoxidans TaxID=93369 RepID=A0A316CM56_PSESE|nr:hypothetical protein [Pseudaminobacter salicylatoxidans]PWJ81515.1 hypothetical protein C7441_11047 [Pseudaminobacter salicylatoxidans]